MDDRERVEVEPERRVERETTVINTGESRGGGGGLIAAIVLLLVVVVLLFLFFGGYFERAAETYVKALWTGKPLRMLSDDIAEKTAAELDNYPGQAERHLAELKAILDEEEPVYRN